MRSPSPRAPTEPAPAPAQPPPDVARTDAGVADADGPDASLAAAPGSTAVLRRCHPALGTFVDIRLSGLPHGRLERALVTARRELKRCERVLSAHRPDNDLARLRDARPGDTLEIDALLRVVLRRAATLSRASDEVFDPRRRVDAGDPPFHASFLLPGRRILLLAPLDLDLGGIAKGHALDRAFAALRRSGVPAFSLNAGGDIRIHGMATNLLLRPPRADSALLLLGVLRSGAAASSAQTYRDHLRAPREGRAAPRSVGVTVLAPSAIDADALTKIVALAPSAPATARLLARARAHAALVGPGGALRWLPAPPPAEVFTPPPPPSRPGSLS